VLEGEGAAEPLGEGVEQGEDEGLRVAVMQALEVGL
jgi:hypothetical protein